MYNKDIYDVAEQIFRLSDQAIIHMLNRMIGRKCTNADYIFRYQEKNSLFNIWITTGDGNHYRCQVRMINGFPQIIIREGRGANTDKTAKAYTLAEYSARKLQQDGLILFLPLLFCCFLANEEEFFCKREQLNYLIFRDIVWALHESMKQGELNVYDVQKLKQLCGRMAWKLLIRVDWLQSMELQELLLEAFQADVELLERIHQQEVKTSGINE